MAGTVDLPAIGKVKTAYVWAGAAVVVVIVGWAYLRNKSSSAASSATTAASAPIDPATGYPQGSAADIAALQAQSSGGTAYDGVGGGYAGAGSGYGAQQYYFDPADGLYDLTSPYTGSSSATSTSNTGPGTFTNDAYWVQYCETNVQGYSASQIQGALAAYLSGLGLTTTQMSIYQACLAVGGPPPTPPSQPAHLATTTSGGGTTTTQVKVPSVVGQSQEAGFAILSAAGLHATGTAIVKGRTLIVQSQNPKAGAEVAKGTTVHLTSKLS